jgi:catechol 2,3-dioxygenase-like lactoylglutathione lyase family enzyme
MERIDSFRPSGPSGRRFSNGKEAHAMGMKLELVAVPVSDVDRAKAFYVDQLGFNADYDVAPGDQVRFVQLTPPDSACSIVIGKGITEAKPGSAPGMTLVVTEIDAVRSELAERGVSISEVEAMPWGARHAHFKDPDGNPWDLQQLAKRS